MVLASDDGAHWQSLRLNLPIVPVHDLTFKQGDLIVATHGRSFYIMDDITTLEQMSERTASAAAHLFKPKDAWRVIWGNPDEPDPARPVGLNPPDGALITTTSPRRTSTLRSTFSTRVIA